MICSLVLAKFFFIQIRSVRSTSFVTRKVLIVRSENMMLSPWDLFPEKKSRHNFEFSGKRKCALIRFICLPSIVLF